MNRFLKFLVCFLAALAFAGASLLFLVIGVIVGSVAGPLGVFGYVAVVFAAGFGAFHALGDDE